MLLTTSTTITTTTTTTITITTITIINTQDLTFIEQGNPNYLVREGDDEKYINWEKRCLVNNALTSVLQYQKLPYDDATLAAHGGKRHAGAVDDAARFCASWPPAADEELYQASLAVEPRGSDPRSLKR